MWNVEYTDEFAGWWATLGADEQASIDFSVLERFGSRLARPHADSVYGSKHSNMKELRTQHRGRPIRTFYAFDPRRNAILLIGGEKTGDNRFYEHMIPIADRLYDQYLEEIRNEGLI